MQPLERAIKRAGGLTKFANSLDVSPQVVSNWLKRRVPTDRCPAIERVTDGLVTKEQLRPDIFGSRAA